MGRLAGSRLGAAVRGRRRRSTAGGLPRGWRRVGAQLVGHAAVVAHVCAAETLPRDDLADDHVPSIGRLRERLDGFGYNSSWGVVMVSGAHEQSFSQLSAPAWEAYCRRHGIDFFLQEEALNSDYRFEWSKPRALLEILPRAPWKYAFLVDANSLPVKLGKHLEYMVKAHLRHKRHATDKASARLMFCPWDCDEEYSNHVEEGACHGPLLSGCILSVKKAGWEKTAELVRSWYVKRKEFRFEDPQALVHAFDQMKRRNSDKVYYRDVQKEAGRPGSSFLATFTHGGDALGLSVRDQMHEFLTRHPELGAAINQASRARERGEL